MNHTQDNTPAIRFEDAVIDGIDMGKVRERYPGKASLDVLRAWCIHTPVLLEKLRACVEKSLPETIEDYIINIHGLKGSSNGIFAASIGKKAEDLEEAAHRKDFQLIAAGNEPLVKEAYLLHQNLEKLLACLAATAEAKPLASSPDTVLLTQLLAACKQYKSSLMEEILDKLEAYQYESGGELLSWLREQIDMLEYAAIQERLEQEIIHT